MCKAVVHSLGLFLKVSSIRLGDAKDEPLDAIQWSICKSHTKSDMKAKLLQLEKYVSKFGLKTNVANSL